MEIKASGKNDRKAIKALTNIRLYRGRNPKAVFWSRTIWFALTAVVLWTLVLFTEFGRKMIGMAIVFVVLYALWVIVMLLMPDLAYRSNGRFADAVNRFTFTDDSVRIEGKGEGFSSEGSYSYESFDRVYETSQYIVVYINKFSAYIVDRSTITPEDYEQLKEKLISSVGKRKFIVCKY